MGADAIYYRDQRKTWIFRNSFLHRLTRESAEQPHNKHMDKNNHNWYDRKRKPKEKTDELVKNLEKIGKTKPMKLASKIGKESN